MQVRNEIAVLKRVSAGHPNICRLVDHFETAHNLYLVFDLCTGGELFDRICSKGNYYERYVKGETLRVTRWDVLLKCVCRDASQIVRTITSAVKYLHDQGIVHRGKPPTPGLIPDTLSQQFLTLAPF